MTTFTKRWFHSLPFCPVALLILVPLYLPDANAAPQQRAGSSEYPLVGMPATVTLLSGGAEPRTRLRYAVPRDYRAQVSQSINSESQVSMDGDALPATPTVAMTKRVEVAVTDASKPGQVTCAIVFTGFSTTGGRGAAKNEADYNSISGTITLDDRGVNRATRFDLSKTSNAQLGQLMANSWADISTPLPDEPIGVGARWEVKNTIHTDAIQALQKTEYELLAFDGKVLTVKASVVQTAVAQRMANPLMPSGSDAQLKKYSGVGNSTITVHLDSLVPATESTLTSTMVVEVSAAGMTMEVRTETTVRVSMARMKSS